MLLLLLYSSAGLIAKFHKSVSFWLFDLWVCWSSVLSSLFLFVSDSYKWDFLCSEFSMKQTYLVVIEQFYAIIWKKIIAITAVSHLVGRLFHYTNHYYTVYKPIYFGHWETALLGFRICSGTWIWTYHSIDVVYNWSLTVIKYVSLQTIRSFLLKYHIDL